MFAWIKSSLEPLEVLWANYYRLYTEGLNGRTTSIGEALHWATKGAFDGVQASMCLSTSANTQMTQAERKGEKVARLNAQNVQMNSLWSNSNTHEFLTDYAERLSSEECILAEDRKCVMVSYNTFWVYKPHTDQDKISECLKLNYVFVLDLILTTRFVLKSFIDRYNFNSILLQSSYCESN